MRSAFLSGLKKTVIAGGNLLHGSCLRNEIAGNVLDHELIVRQVLVEGAYHVVAVRGDLHEVIAVISCRVGKAHKIKPMHGHSLTVARVIHETINKLSVGLIGGILEKRIRFIGGGWDAKEVKVEPP